MQKIREKSLVIKTEGFFGLLEGENAGRGNGIRRGGNALYSPERNLLKTKSEGQFVWKCGHSPLKSQKNIHFFFPPTPKKYPIDEIDASR